jgi:hypothetical protein
VDAACSQPQNFEVCQEIIGQIVQNAAALSHDPCQQKAADAVSGALGTVGKIATVAAILPALRVIRSAETITSGVGGHSYNFWSSQSTDSIIGSLAPGAAEPLTVNAEGAIIDGNTRIYVLLERGIDVNGLPRVTSGGGLP